ncbi:hypothetical protein Q3G72_005989 [Acer saccharum]|nr:hypothetical protein Q3G72_005989 [Acer saccharum]
MNVPSPTLRGDQGVKSFCHVGPPAPELQKDPVGADLVSSPGVDASGSDFPGHLGLQFIYCFFAQTVLNRFGFIHSNPLKIRSFSESFHKFLFLHLPKPDPTNSLTDPMASFMVNMRRLHRIFT